MMIEKIMEICGKLQKKFTAELFIFALNESFRLLNVVFFVFNTSSNYQLFFYRGNPNSAQKNYENILQYPVLTGFHYIIIVMIITKLFYMTQ